MPYQVKIKLVPLCVNVSAPAKRAVIFVPLAAVPSPVIVLVPVIRTFGEFAAAMFVIVALCYVNPTKRCKLPCASKSIGYHINCFY